jgi:hypothetical protein
MALWDPTTNAIQAFQNSAGSNDPYPSLSTCAESIQAILLTNNRTRVVIAPQGQLPGNPTLCSLDPIADTWNLSGPALADLYAEPNALAVSGDGSTLVAYDDYSIYNLDPTTLAVKNSFAISAKQSVSNYPEIMVSNDGTQVFLTDPGGVDILDVFDLANGTQTGWIPQANGTLVTQGILLSGPLYQAISQTGLAAGVMQSLGIGLLDTTAVRAMPVGSHLSQTQLQLATGPVAGDTATAWQESEFGASPQLGSIYFGTNTATSINAGYMFTAVTPAGTPGPVDVRTFSTDGGSQLIPWGFTYGPWVLETTTNYATADGGGEASLYGMGFGTLFADEENSYLAAPSDLQVEVGTSSAKVEGYLPNLYGRFGSSGTAPPLPVNTLLYTVPPGVAGATSTVSVATPSGTVTASKPLTYLPATQQFPVDGVLADGVYDSRTDLYYFSDASQIRVFSLATGGWQTSIAIPAPSGANGPQRLMGLALSPDGSKLVIADPGAIAIYVVNLAQGNSVQSFALAGKIPGVFSNDLEPLDPVITNDGMIYFTPTDDAGSNSCGVLYQLNPSTGAVTPEQSLYGANPEGNVCNIALSSDGSRIYFVGYTIGYFNIASQTFDTAPFDRAKLAWVTNELVFSPNHETLFASGLILDSSLNTLGLQSLDLAESVDASYVFGTAFSADGNLLFQPGTGFIDVFDGRTGSFRARVSVPFTLSPNFRALISDQTDSNLVAITGGTGSGIAVINLNSLPEPPPLPYLLLKGAGASRVQAPRLGRPNSPAERLEARFPRVAPRIRHLPSPLLQNLGSRAKSLSR